MKFNFPSRVLWVPAMLLVAGCVRPQAAATQSLSVAYTQVAMTVMAALTQNATAASRTPTPARVTAKPELVPTLPPSATPLPMASLLPPATLLPTSPLVTNVPQLATDTPLAAPTSQPSTPIPGTTTVPNVSTTPVATGVPVSGAPAEAYKLAFQDDFSSPIGWSTEQSDTFGFQFARGGYRIHQDKKNTLVWSVKTDEYSDVRLEVDGARFSGAQEGFYGLVCRHVSGGKYYALMVSGNGAYGIIKQAGGQLEWLQQGIAPAGTINLGTGTNHLRGDCVGNTLTLYVNGHKLGEAQDSDYPSGAVGMGIRTLSLPVFDAQFDNFQLWLP